MAIFDKNGYLENGEAQKWSREIASKTGRLFDGLVAEGVSVTEIRALSHWLSGSIDEAAAGSILRNAGKQRRTLAPKTTTAPTVRQGQ
jgi:hypothetical protein